MNIIRQFLDSIDACTSDSLLNHIGVALCAILENNADRFHGASVNNIRDAILDELLELQESVNWPLEFYDFLNEMFVFEDHRIYQEATQMFASLAV